MKLRDWTGKLLTHKTSSIVVISILMQLVCILFVPRYFTALNIQVLLRAIPELAILSIGVCLLMIAGEFDLSVGSTYALTAFLMNDLVKFGINVWIALLLTLLIGCLLGAINGILTIKARIPSFIVTLGTMMAWRGVVLIITGGFMQSFLPSPLFHFVFAGELGSMLQMQFVWAVVIGVLFWIVLENHKFGNAIFATGGNRKAAIEIGINPDAVKFICFVVLGLLVAFCSTLGMTRISSIAPLQGQGLEMVAVAAVVIGGTNLRGGEGDILGACLGAITIYTIQDALLLLRAPGFYFQLFVGVFIILAVVAKGFVRSR